MPTVHLLIKGEVQGVFYRANAKEVANQIGVSGWIRNTRAGDVEAMVTGTEEQLEAFIKWCNIGPERAVVDTVIRTVQEETKFDSFEVQRGKLF